MLIKPNSIEIANTVQLRLPNIMWTCNTHSTIVGSDNMRTSPETHSSLSQPKTI